SELLSAPRQRGSDRRESVRGFSDSVAGIVDDAPPPGGILRSVERRDLHRYGLLIQDGPAPRDLPSRSTRVPILCDPVEDPAIRVLPTDALSLLEQAPCSRRGARVLREQRPPPELQRRGWRGGLHRVAAKCPPTLAVELESPLHSAAHGHGSKSPIKSFTLTLRTLFARPAPEDDSSRARRNLISIPEYRRSRLMIYI